MNKLIIAYRTYVRYTIFGRRSSPQMVYCRKCRQQVEDCSHFVPPLNIPPTDVFDQKVKTLAYKEDGRILEIVFKSGQTWQLRGVPPDVYQELLHATLS